MLLKSAQFKFRANLLIGENMNIFLPYLGILIIPSLPIVKSGLTRLPCSPSSLLAKAGYTSSPLLLLHLIIKIYALDSRRWTEENQLIYVSAFKSNGRKSFVSLSLLLPLVIKVLELRFSLAQVYTRERPRSAAGNLRKNH